VAAVGGVAGHDSVAGFTINAASEEGEALAPTTQATVPSGYRLHPKQLQTEKAQVTTVASRFKHQW
jgi:hypothetical protein